jgi:hypothetical protein
MHRPYTRSAFERGMRRVAGMLSIVTAWNAVPSARSRHGFQLVSWSPGAHSRREDELARTRRGATENPDGDVAPSH